MAETYPSGMQTPSGTAPGGLTVDRFMEDRQAFWGSFTRFVTGGVIFLAVLLILMAIFLV